MQEIHIWSEIAGTVNDLLSGLLSATEQAVTYGLPRVILAGVTLVVGWLLAVFVRKLTAKGLRGVGLDLIMDRTGVRALLVRRGVEAAPSAIMAWAIYALILYSAFVRAFERLDFQTGLALLAVIAEWMPRILVALILLAIGQWMGRWLGHIVARAARVAMIPAAPVAGALVQVAIVVFAVLLAVRYLDLAPDGYLIMGLALILGAVIVLMLLVMWCARDVLLSLMAVQMLRSLYRTGTRVRIDRWEGEIMALQHHTVQLRTDQGTVDLPAVLFLRTPVVRLPVDGKGD